MYKYGLHPKIVKWVGSFLCGRTQQVVVDGHLSFAALIISGVPQGTVLGPILFIIFINDLETLTREAVERLFADDDKVARLVASEEDARKLQADINHFAEWADIWGMKFNVSKCKVMHVGKKNPKDGR